MPTGVLRDDELKPGWIRLVKSPPPPLYNEQLGLRRFTWLQTPVSCLIYSPKQLFGWEALWAHAETREKLPIFIKKKSVRSDEVVLALKALFYIWLLPEIKAKVSCFFSFYSPNRLLNSSQVPSVTSFKDSTTRTATVLRWSIGSLSVVPHLSERQLIWLSSMNQTTQNEHCVVGLWKQQCSCRAPGRNVWKDLRLNVGHTKTFLCNFGSSGLEGSEESGSFWSLSQRNTIYNI